MGVKQTTKQTILDVLFSSKIICAAVNISRSVRLFMQPAKSYMQELTGSKPARFRLIPYSLKRRGQTIFNGLSVAWTARKPSPVADDSCCLQCIVIFDNYVSENHTAWFDTLCRKGWFFLMLQNLVLRYILCRTMFDINLYTFPLTNVLTIIIMNFKESCINFFRVVIWTDLNQFTIWLLIK